MARSTGQSTDFRASAAEMQRQAIIAAGREERRQHDVDLAADERRDHRQEDDHGDPGAVIPHGSRVLDIADQVEVGVVAEGPREVGADLEQQRVAGVQLDVSHLVGQPGTVAMNGHNRRVVQRPEVGLAHASGPPAARKG